MNWQDWCPLNAGGILQGHPHSYPQPKRRGAPRIGSDGYAGASHERNACGDRGRTKSLQKILENALSKAGEVEKRMAAYSSRLESRIAQLPKELETGLDPPRIAKLLGESLRQSFQQSGLPDTARALDQSCSEMNSIQEQLVNVLREVAHPDIGVIEKVRSANDSLLRSMTTRAQQMDDFLVRLQKQVWAVWLPVVASAALALGFFLGSWFASERQASPETP